MESRDVAFDLVVLADLGIAPQHPALGRVKRLEPDDFAPWMASLTPAVTVPTAAGAVRIEAGEPRGFRPEALAARIPEANPPARGGRPAGSFASADITRAETARGTPRTR